MQPDDITTDIFASDLKGQRTFRPIAYENRQIAY